MLGWYIKQGSLMTSVDRLQNANIYIKDAALVDSIEEVPTTPEQIVSASEQPASNGFSIRTLRLLHFFLSREIR